MSDKMAAIRVFSKGEATVELRLEAAGPVGCRPSEVRIGPAHGQNDPCACPQPRQTPGIRRLNRYYGSSVVRGKGRDTRYRRTFASFKVIEVQTSSVLARTVGRSRSLGRRIRPELHAKGRCQAPDTGGWPVVRGRRTPQRNGKCHNSMTPEH